MGLGATLMALYLSAQGLIGVLPPSSFNDLRMTKRASTILQSCHRSTDQKSSLFLGAWTIEE